jgi:probable F420-dependent oxidoreductase
LETDLVQPELRPFSFAVQAAPAKHPHDWASVARRAEDLGYRALLVPDHQGSGGPITGIAIAGANTTSLKVGSLVMAVDFHNPVVLIQELMTLAALLEGRLEVGLGAGWMARDYERTGTYMAPAASRIDSLSEFVSLLIAMWTGAPTTHTGSRYRCEDAVGAPRPTDSDPCLVLGGGGRRMIELAAELASIVNLGASMTSGTKTAPLGAGGRVEAFARRADWVRVVAKRRGFLPELQCLAYETCITANARDHVQQHVCDSFGLPPDEVLNSPLALVGTIDEVREKLLALRAHLGISYWVVKSPVMDDFSPVVAGLAGS